jgi:plasmid stabilization system protein ParE
MKYVVIVTPEAQANIAVTYLYIAERAPMNAVKWLRDVNSQIEGLELFPRRFGKAREQVEFAEEIRQVVFKSHRIIFTIDDIDRTVHVVFVRHGKMRAVGDVDDTEGPLAMIVTGLPRIAPPSVLSSAELSSSTMTMEFLQPSVSSRPPMRAEKFARFA